MSDRRRALMSLVRGESVLTGVVTVETGNKLTIPAKAGQNFVVMHNEPAGTEMSGGELVALFRLILLSSDRVYRIKDDSPGTTPPIQTIGVMPTSAAVQNADAIVFTATNANTQGLAKVGRNYRYFIW